MTSEIFQSSIKLDGHIAGVFEHDGEAGYFYLCDLSRPNDKQVVASIHLTSEPPDFSESQVQVTWNKSGDIVGVFIKDQLWAAFSFDGAKYGGNYRPGCRPGIAVDVVASF
jgi:hypothetical protein